ncbi:MAG: hypothetical protein KTR31_33660 [Myxococcales bacterium]|nr:hypothetical protein [Myxococcales bacterium]
MKVRFLLGAGVVWCMSTTAIAQTIGAECEAEYECETDKVEVDVGIYGWMCCPAVRTQKRWWNALPGQEGCVVYDVEFDYGGYTDCVAMQPPCGGEMAPPVPTPPGSPFDPNNASCPDIVEEVSAPAVGHTSDTFCCKDCQKTDYEYQATGGSPPELQCVEVGTEQVYIQCQVGECPDPPLPGDCEIEVDPSELEDVCI